jgi:hypothetical protein
MKLIAIALVLIGGGVFSVGAICGGTPPPSVAEISSEAAVAESFSEYPLVWLGAAYDADGDGFAELPLTSTRVTHDRELISPATDEVIIPAATHFVMGYGTCHVPPDRETCTIPMTIVVYPPDHPIPPIAEAVRTDKQVRLRGVVGISHLSGLWIDTGEFRVNITIPDSDPQRQLERAIDAAMHLTGANALASHITVESNFLPPPPATPTPEPVLPEPTPEASATEGSGPAVDTPALEQGGLP